MRETKMVICLRKDLTMRKGKMVSQGAHSAMKFIIDQYVGDCLLHDGSTQFTVTLTAAQTLWLMNAFTKVTCYVTSEQELRDLIAKARAEGVEVKEIIDSGRTEFHGIPTLTCAAFGPDYTDVLDPITGHLPLL